jgi:uncharacterized protein
LQPNSPEMVNIKVKKLVGFKKTRGLIGSKKPFAIFFQTRFGVHTYGLHFPIDVVILDNNNNVVKMKENLKPNQIYLWNPRFDRVLELRAGESAKNRIKLGQIISLDFI